MYKTTLQKQMSINSKRHYKKSRQEYPWIFNYRDARTRCTNKNYVKYERYGGRGIQMKLSEADVEHLWFRDGAYMMDRPSLDRADNDGDYTLENCCFIEFAENNKRRWDSYKEAHLV